MKLPYFKLGEAWDNFIIDAECEQGIKKLNGFTKLVGKTVANTGMLAVEAAVTIVKEIPTHVGKTAEKTLKEQGDSLSEEQREKLNKIIKKSRELQAKNS